jgi:XTP/dITP diphosphohydrolase
VDGLTVRLASANPHKLEELRPALPGWRLELLGDVELPPETGDTYEDNARGKALFGRALAAADEWVLGEDSGIEVAALGGGPGVRSARYAEPGEDANEKLLAALEGADDRRARYVCTIVAVGPEGGEVVARGELAGRIAAEPAGGEGFGYDPIFVPEGEERTVAELGDGWKRVHSHRARAARELRRALGS